MTTTEIREFQQYLARLGREATSVPQALREGAPAPASWTGTAEQWEEVRAQAARAYEQKPAYDFAYDIAVRGYRPSELATGRLDPGARINAMSGAIIRPPQSTIPPATQDRTRDALRALAARNLKIDAVLQQNLELAAYGRYTSHPRGAEAAISAADSAVQRYESTRQAAAKEEAARPMLTVHRPFRAIGGKHYAPGTYRVDPAVVAELQEWRERMEAQAEQRGWDAPSGFNPGHWPPFTSEADA